MTATLTDPDFGWMREVNRANAFEARAPMAAQSTAGACVSVQFVQLITTRTTTPASYELDIVDNPDGRPRRQAIGLAFARMERQNTDVVSSGKTR